MVLAVTSYDFSVFLHVTAVVVGFGAARFTLHSLGARRTLAEERI